MQLEGPIATPLRRFNVPDEDPNLLIGPEEVAEVILFVATRGKDVIIPEIAIYPRAFIPAEWCPLHPTMGPIGPHLPLARERGASGRGANCALHRRSGE